MKIKNSLIISIMIVSSFAEIKAQEDERKHEISIGIGVWSTSNLSFALGDALVNAIDFAGNVKFEDQTASPAYHISYKYFPTQKFSIGATMTAGSEKATGRIENQYDGSLKRIYSNIAIEPAYTYLNRKYFKLYVLAGVGLLYLHQDYTPNNGNKNKQSLYTADFQITPIGIKVGNTLGAYLEGGIGYKGIVSIGLFYKL
ncbi:MAG: hypothetical protein LBN11_03935 [Tannerella sp.]|jgi:hypothetical protein|nr:hypothetical protein [Tannerella sp.]